MFELASLNRNKSYLISNNPGQWRYSRCSGSKYFFWKYSSEDVNRRITLSLSLDEVKYRVWEEVQSLDLSKLEAFRGL